MFIRKQLCVIKVTLEYTVKTRETDEEQRYGNLDVNSHDQVLDAVAELIDKQQGEINHLLPILKSKTQGENNDGLHGALAPNMFLSTRCCLLERFSL